MTHGTSPAIAQLKPDLARGVGSILREARRARQLSQVDIEIAIGIAQTTQSRIEQGRVCPTLPVFMLLAYGVQVPPGQLLARIGDLPAVQAALLAAVKKGGRPTGKR
jgi:transcriptional regulator with XRE-family HTH domain